MDKRDYFNRAKAEVERARQRLPNHAGGCDECRWSRSGFMYDTCAHPAVICAAFNVTDAYNKKRIQECDEQRDTDAVWGPVLCGPDGALFEPKPDLWWKRIFARETAR